MAVRRPNKKAPAGTTSRKQTVAGRKRAVDAGSSTSTPDVEAAETTAVETTAVETTAAETTAAETTAAETTATTVESATADTATAETATMETTTVDSADDVQEQADDVDDFVAVDDDPEPSGEQSEPSGERVLLVKPDEDDAEKSGAEKSGAEKSDTEKSDDTEAKPTGKARRPVARVSTIRAGATTPIPTTPAPSTESTSKLDAAKSTAGQWAKRVTPTSTSGFVTSRNAVRLGVAAAVIGLIALILAFTPGAKIESNKAFVDRAATDELTSQARSKVCLPVAVTSQDFDKWSNQARGVLVGTALKNFNDYLPTQKKLIEQSKLVADCRVDAIGVRELTGSGDGAQAKVLANILVSQNLGEQLLNSASVRVDYTLEKHGDQWLISGVDPF
ncbi:hypothetical protein HH308_25855 [Gordonia sp. TBRC 11910]|uniref:Mce-associated membrane protein n=1 Tax=Gordonia asplenii TaxID=2725283 RepID=A0A848L0Z5_9ACTN|nr:hypothetical protein [Gordonia asplenii]NMO04650.1 hypothetical protein [Gordonia asplenii]